MRAYRDNLAETPPAAAGDSLTVPPAEPRRRFGMLAGAACVLLMIGLVVGPVVYVGLPREVARWHIAAALEERLDGDLDAAIRSLDQALEKFPDNDQLLRQRAQWRMENRQYAAALRDADRAVQLARDRMEAYLIRSQIYQHLGRHAEAVEDWNTLVRLGERGGRSLLANALNGRAYARAVGGIELNGALADVDQALRLVGDNEAMLDTRGFIRYLRGDDQAARADLDRAVALVEALHEALNQLVAKGRLGVPDLRQFEFERKERAETVAVIRYHRALLYDRLNDKERAEADRRRVRELGFEPTPQLF